MIMKKLLLALVLSAPIAAQACFLSGERISGMNKICYYDCVSGTKTITIRSTSLCPLSLYREMLTIMGVECDG